MVIRNNVMSEAFLDTHRKTGNVGGPPVNGSQNGMGPQQPDCNNSLFQKVQDSIDCSCASTGLDGGSLCRATAAGNALFSPPWSCMVELLNNQSVCGTVIPQDKVRAAYDAWSKVTGFVPPDYVSIFADVQYNQETVVNFIGWYMYIPVLLLGLTVIWLGVGFGWFNWVVGIFLSLLAFVLHYGFSIAFRINAIGWLRTQNDENVAYYQGLETAFENSIAYWPQGLFAAACAITCDDPNNECWTCNNPGCTTSTRAAITHPRAAKAAVPYIEKEETKSPEKSAKKSKRVRRR